MLRIGMVGVNTNHAEAFTRIFNGDAEQPGAIPDARITHVCAVGQDDRLAELVTMFGDYDHVVADPTELIDAVDGVLVIDDTDGGATHASLARPFLSAGMPVFIDKPMTTAYADAVELFELAEANAAPILSSSALRFPVELDRGAIQALGKLSAIVSVGPEEWFYYGVHAVELVGAIASDTPVSVYRAALEQKDVALVTYESGLVATIMTLRDAGYLFHATVYGVDGRLDFAVDDYVGFYTNEMKAFVEMMRTGESPVSREQTLAVLGILHAGIRSAEEGRVVTISEISQEAGQ